MLSAKLLLITAAALAQKVNDIGEHGTEEGALG